VLLFFVTFNTLTVFGSDSIRSVSSLAHPSSSFSLVSGSDKPEFSVTAHVLVKPLDSTVTFNVRSVPRSEPGDMTTGYFDVSHSVLETSARMCYLSNDRHKSSLALLQGAVDSARTEIGKDGVQFIPKGVGAFREDLEKARKFEGGLLVIFDPRLRGAALRGSPNPRPRLSSEMNQEEISRSELFFQTVSEISEKTKTIFDKSISRFSEFAQVQKLVSKCPPFPQKFEKKIPAIPMTSEPLEALSAWADFSALADLFDEAIETEELLISALSAAKKTAAVETRALLQSLNSDKLVIGRKVRDLEIPSPTTASTEEELIGQIAVVKDQATSKGRMREIARMLKIKFSLLTSVLSRLPRIPGCDPCPGLRSEIELLRRLTN